MKIEKIAKLWSNSPIKAIADPKTYAVNIKQKIDDTVNQIKQTDFGEKVKQFFDDLTQNVILLINGVPYLFHSSWVEESYGSSTSYEEAWLNDLPPILIPESHTLKLKITIPYGDIWTKTKYMAIKMFIRTQQLLIATTNVTGVDDKITPAKTFTPFDSYRFTNLALGDKKSAEEAFRDRFIKRCRKENNIKFSPDMSDADKKIIKDCVNLKEAERQQELKAMKEKELEAKNCPKETDPVLARINKFNLKALSIKEKTKARNKKLKEFFKGAFKRDAENKLGFMKIKLPWQVQVMCGYLGRCEVMAVSTLINFTSSNAPGTTTDVWDIELLGYRLRKDPRKQQFKPIDNYHVLDGGMEGGSQSGDCRLNQSEPDPKIEQGIKDNQASIQEQKPVSKPPAITEKPSQSSFKPESKPVNNPQHAQPVSKTQTTQGYLGNCKENKEHFVSYYAKKISNKLFKSKFHKSCAGAKGFIESIKGRGKGKS